MSPALRVAIAPAAALAYPFALAGFHRGVAAHADGKAWGAVLAAACLVAAFAVPLVALAMAMRLGASGTRRRATAIALLAVAAPALFTFVGVILYMLRDPVPDIALWAAAWSVLLVVAARSPASKMAPATASLAPRWRVAHGVAALVAVGIFLAFHIANHLFGLAGPDAHGAMMRFGRQLYRVRLIEPALVSVLLFLVGSGMYLLWVRAGIPMDRFRALQVASGAYLIFFVLGHMNSIFVFARSWLGIETDWAFATGAPAGLIADAWNIRLVPHYAFGVFFLLVHLASGGRTVLLAHGRRNAVADRLVIMATTAAAFISGAIMLGMCGLRINVG